ncbi:MAG: hypothetical protein KDC84_00630 [Crocinitomicaceae bacterium]|nr:hypothetical protein [Crocinitomicaceae bacterium]
MAEVLVPISVFAMSFGIAYIAIMSNHREKMSMLEKGINPKDYDLERKKHKDSRKGAMVLIAVGLGLFLGNVIQENHSIPGSDVAIPALICLFIGIALFAYHGMARKESAND